MGGVHATWRDQSHVQQIQALLQPRHLCCRRQAHLRHGSCCRPPDHRRTHRTHHRHILHLPQSRQGNGTDSVACGEYAYERHTRRLYFFNEDFSETIAEPRYVEHHKVTDEVFAPGSHLLEINSKSGLYPLYLAYNLYRRACKDAMFSPQTLDEHLAIWDKAVADSIFVICKTPMAKAITRRTLMGFRRGTVNMWAPEDLINKIKNQPELFIKKVHDLVGKDVKINAIVGNPPYQEIDGGGTGDSAKPIYNTFVDIAKQLEPGYLSMIMPSRWLKGGKGLVSFRESMMADERIAFLCDYADARICFPSIHIDGGVCYFRWDATLSGTSQNVEYIYHALNGEVIKSFRQLKNKDSKTVIRDPRQQSIIEKVSKVNFKPFSLIVSSRNPFGFNADLFNNPERYPDITLREFPQLDCCRVYGVKGIKGGAKRIQAYIQSQNINKSLDSIDKYKIFFSKAYMTTSTVPPALIMGNPGDICTETFLKIGDFTDEITMLNCCTFIYSKFCRALLFYNRSSLNISQETFDLIPLQDFSIESDINWSQSVADIDRQLYTKYNLTEDEIAFIESMIKPM